MIRPVFIGGCERSGTTFLASMLGGHPSVVVTPESQFKMNILCGEKIERRLLWRLRIWGIDYNEREVPKNNGKSYLDHILCSYASTVGVRDPSIWIDHTPNNLRFAETLLTHYEDAKFIHIIRDGRAVAASVLPLDWGPINTYDAANWWLARLSFGFGAERKLPGRVITIRYEDLLLNPTYELDRVREFCDIPPPTSAPNDLTESFHVPAYTRKQHHLVGIGPQLKRLDAWKQSLSKTQIETFESQAADMLAYLGYSPIFDSPRAPSLLKRLRFRLSIIRYIKDRIQGRLRRLRS